MPISQMPDARNNGNGNPLVERFRLDSTSTRSARAPARVKGFRTR